MECRGNKIKSKTIELLDYTNVKIENILLITNTTDNVIIYNFSNNLFGGNITNGNILNQDLSYQIHLNS